MKPLLVYSIFFATAFPLINIAEGLRRHDCDSPCKAGNCLFDDCEETVDCPGGLCEFHRCKNPTCSGGACSFYESAHATCQGGGCHFHKPVNTLLDGYCGGGMCNLNGKPHSTTFKDRLSF
mmetsp:Transcript_16008/g.32763  ORF Transcript_16008/g.32763 Transcript_16008/m.32763 type:complete len:121 (-) Transcript_16008:167-529(-)